MHLCGNYTEAALQRTAKSMKISDHLRDKLYPQYVDRYPDPHVKYIFMNGYLVKTVVKLSGLVIV